MYVVYVCVLCAAELLIWLGSFALVAAAAFACLTVFACLQAQTKEENVAPPAAPCKVGQWTEWTICPVECGDSHQTRYREITVSSY